MRDNDAHFAIYYELQCPRVLFRLDEALSQPFGFTNGVVNVGQETVGQSVNFDKTLLHTVMPISGSYGFQMCQKLFDDFLIQHQGSGERSGQIEVIVEVNNRSTDINTFHIFDLCLKTTTQVLIFKEQATMILQFGHAEWKEIAVWA